MTLLVLDLDGTLLDCETRQVALTRWMLAQRELPALEAAAFWRHKRAGASTGKALEAQYGAAPWLSEFTQAWQAAIEQPQWLESDQLLPGVAAELAYLRSRGTALHLLTARSNPVGLHATLERLALTRYFAQVRVVDPAHASALKAEALAAWLPRAFIGDTESDCAAAASSGIPFVAVSWGQRDAAWLAAHGAANCYPNLGAALAHLDSGPAQPNSQP